MRTATATTPRVDIYTKVTEDIIAKLETGVRPWVQPWSGHASGPVCRPLRHNGIPYSGINILMLWSQAHVSGYASPFWLTFQQAKELGGHVKKGEHGSPVVYASTYTKKEKGEDGQETEEEIPFLKQYTVFAADQIEGLPPHFYALAEPAKTTVERIAHAEAFFAGTKADIRHGGTQAFYSPAEDYIRIPPIEAFRDAESHASTVCHELTHWTKAPSRLTRQFGKKKIGDEGYAIEELVAELGAAFLCADLRITTEVREDHASYIEHWLKILKSDKRAIFSAASHASKAVDFLHGLQPQAAA